MGGRADDKATGVAAAVVGAYAADVAYARGAAAVVGAIVRAAGLAAYVKGDVEYVAGAARTPVPYARVP
jgi:hypothetical protein